MGVYFGPEVLSDVEVQGQPLQTSELGRRGAQAPRVLGF